MNAFERKLRGLPPPPARPKVDLYRPNDDQLVDSILTVKAAIDDDVATLSMPCLPLLALFEELQELRGKK